MKLMEGLKTAIPSEAKRRRHILEKMLYMVELNGNNVRLMRKIFSGNEYNLNIIKGDFLKPETHKKLLARLGTKELKFDLVMGNPPYNKKFSNAGASPLYHEFVEKCIDDCKYLTFIIPSRWFSGGKGLSRFRKMMLNRKDLKYIVHIDDANEVFDSSVEIKGGVNYFLKDHKHNGKCSFNGNLVNLSKYDVLTDFNGISIVEKVRKLPSITELYVGRFFKIETNNTLLQSKGKTLCYVSLEKSKNRKLYINYELQPNMKFWKVVTTEAAHKAGSGFGTIFIGDPNSVHTGSYISFKLKTKQEAESLLSYLHTRFANYLLSLRKSSQHISEHTCKWIPLVPLDKTWDNNQVYNFFKLTEKEINIIESKNLN